eukprot:TRINITY_DN22973_c0_g1_i2.p1 TRINITY_DN22973_c0_g1~~TRINITY_DN22973_c0_g1_i2.p1  ORF type:complete len:211 (-),score=59.17 TRINITY_DN22973_c0_g1_i2:10-642(-)
MSCPKCLLAFNAGDNLPLILPECGDTLCLACASLILLHSNIICPVCRRITHDVIDVSLLPRNVPLLESCSKSSRGEICALHGKSLEAFCEAEKVLVCIDCILLGEHKTHEVSAISEASKKARALMNGSVETSKRLKDSLKAALECVEMHRGELKTKVEEQKELIAKQFDKLIESIKEHETKLNAVLILSLIHICRCRRYAVCRSRWSPYH